jgi:uncharacterized protein YqgV (UPF0045/DUF77 family)
MKNSLLLSLQIIPTGTEEKKTAAFKKIQSDIEQCGLPFKSEEFGYVLEGQYEPMMRLIEALQLAAFNAGAEEIQIIIRLRSANGKDLKLS